MSYLRWPDRLGHYTEFRTELLESTHQRTNLQILSSLGLIEVQKWAAGGQTDDITNSIEDFFTVTGDCLTKFVWTRSVI
jgi:hypothetical protein